MDFCGLVSPSYCTYDDVHQNATLKKNDVNDSLSSMGLDSMKIPSDEINEIKIVEELWPEKNLTSIMI